jgi:hypothetical protein
MTSSTTRWRPWAEPGTLAVTPSPKMIDGRKSRRRQLQHTETVIPDEVVQQETE